MTIQLRVIQADAITEYTFDRKEVSIGRGPLNELVLNDEGLSQRHGSLVMGNRRALTFTCQGGNFPTSIFRGEVCVATVGSGERQTLTLRSGDRIRIGASEPIDIEVTVTSPEKSTKWKLYDMPSPDRLRPTSDSGQLLFRLTTLLSRDLRYATLLRALTKLISTLTEVMPARATLAVLTSEDEYHDVVFTLVPDGEEDLAEPLSLGEVTPSFDPLQLLGSARLELLEQLRQSNAYAVSTPSDAEGPTRIFLPVRREADVVAILTVELPDPPSDMFLSSLAIAGALISPLTAIVLQNQSLLNVTRSLEEENRHFRDRGRRHYLFKELVCESEKMRAVYEKLNGLVESEEPNVPLVFVGEAGTGKELLARALHHLDSRKRGMMISLNCVGLADEPAEALDYELFGCIESELAGAIAPRKGVFELAHRSTVFLEEIDQLSPLMQGKLLRMLNEGEVRRVGDSVGRRVDVRIVASVHRDVQALLADGALRRDLYYALQANIIEVPALRERQADIMPLARIFLRMYRDRYGREANSFSDEVAERFLAYSWPGNVRELQTLVESAVLKSTSETISMKELSFS